jgi:hypothetical protein
LFPTSQDVVDYLNARFAARNLPYEIESIVVLPYVNPMWLANWDVPQLADALDRKVIDEKIREVIDEEIREARWRYPQVTAT